MSKNLVIVESPAKAKTIEGYLGKDFSVKSSFGHIRDLPKSGLAIDVENNFEPQYEILTDKKDLVKQLKKEVSQSEMVWLATDDDREGEAISWHLVNALGLNPANTKRIVFREITKSAITKSIENPRGINESLVNSQQARRILDRLVGYELSPVLWRKIKTGLSAGRVQSVAVRVVVEREREIEAFTSTSAFRVRALFDVGAGKLMQADLKKRFDTSEEAEAFLNDCKEADFTIADLQKKPSKRRPAAPFTTSTLQQEASRKLGFSVSQTMIVAQRLYEAGKITYMRTDSVNLAESAIQGAKEAIVAEYGPQYSHERRYKTNKEGAQEAHEAIRPTNLSASVITGDRNDQRLYDLIYKRTIASQMADAQIEKTTAEVNVSTRNEAFVATGEVIKFEGFLKVYVESTDNEDDDENAPSSMLPPLTVGQQLGRDKITATQLFKRPAPRYTEASLVKKLEELGIGRPSTYAPTISTIIKRGYAVKESREGVERQYCQIELTGSNLTTETKTEITGAEKMKLFPTSTGVMVNDFLIEFFPSIVDFSFTADVEKKLDMIALGSESWDNMIKEFYKDFHQKVEESSLIGKEDFNKARELGQDPKSGRNMYAKIGRYGAYVQIGENEEEDKKFASLRHNQRTDTITHEEALKLFDLPRDIGEFEDKKMVVGVGRFGPYVRHDSKFVSIPKDEDPLTLTSERGIELILEKRKKDAEKLIKQFDENPDIQVLNGQWGPYIKAGKKNVKIPKDKDAKTLTLDECLKLAEATPDKPKRAAKKTTTRKKK